MPLDVLDLISTIKNPSPKLFYRAAMLSVYAERLLEPEMANDFMETAFSRYSKNDAQKNSEAVTSCRRSAQGQARRNPSMEKGN